MESREFRVMLLACLAAWILAGAVGLETRASSRQEGDMLVRLFGGTAEVASQGAVERADLYLHAGTGYVCHEDNEREAACPLPLYSVVDKVHRATTPETHKHIQGAQEKELLPWFFIATRLNRHNVEAWLDGTYWLYRTGQRAEAERFITEGIRSNPKDHRVYLERGIYYHRMRRYDRAAKDLEASVRLYKKINDESPFELKAARIYLRDSQEKLKAQ